jgi:hypothetical protein
MFWKFGISFTGEEIFIFGWTRYKEPDLIAGHCRNVWVLISIPKDRADGVLHPRMLSF